MKMTVAELIEELRKYPPDIDVLHCDCQSEYFFEVDGVKEHKELAPYRDDDAYKGQHVIELTSIV